VSVQIREETADDLAAIDSVLERAFGGRAEVDLVRTLRRDRLAPISLVAVEGSAVVGNVQFCRLTSARPDDAIPALGLAPLAVVPSHQRRGIGAKLVRAGLERARAMGERLVFVLGDPAYYGRFGFSAEAAEGFECVYACEAFQVLVLDGTLPANAMGRVVYPPPFDALDGDSLDGGEQG
jgi:putative acetyltransferase